MNERSATDATEISRRSMLKGSLLVAATALPGVALGESERREPRVGAGRHHGDAGGLHARGAIARAAARCARAHEAPRARHGGGDGLRSGPRARARGARLRARVRRRAGRHGDSFEDAHWTDRSGARERHDGARRRDRRLARAVAVPPGMLDRSRGPCRCRAIPRRRRRACCERSRWATTSARGPTWRSAPRTSKSATIRAATLSAGSGVRRRPRVPREAVGAATADGCWPTPRISRAEPRCGSATPITFRKPSCSRASARETA